MEPWSHGGMASFYSIFESNRTHFPSYKMVGKEEENIDLVILTVSGTSVHKH